MNDTLKRLKEAEILLDRMKNSTSNHFEFRTNLNAFIPQARSITLVMQKEFSKTPQFEEWYKSKQSEMQKDELLMFFIEQRNKSQKEKSVGKIGTITRLGTLTTSGSTLIPLIKFEKDGNVKLHEIDKDTIKDMPRNAVKTPTTILYTFDEKLGEDAIDLCSTYLQKLKIIVTECYGKFSLNKSQSDVPTGNAENDVP